MNWHHVQDFIQASFLLMCTPFIGRITGRITHRVCCWWSRYISRWDKWNIGRSFCRNKNSTTHLSNIPINDGWNACFTYMWDRLCITDLPINDEVSLERFKNVWRVWVTFGRKHCLQIVVNFLSPVMIKSSAEEESQWLLSVLLSFSMSLDNTEIPSFDYLSLSHWSGTCCSTSVSHGLHILPTCYEVTNN